MKRPPFVTIDKTLADTFKEIRRPYSKIEAVFSYALDVNCGEIRSLRSYARMWSWSMGRVKRFLIDPKTGGTVTEQQRNSNGTLKPLERQGIDDGAEQQRNSNGTATEHKYKEQRTKNKEKNKQPVRKRVSYGENFSSFWKKYPRDENKKKAYDVWKRKDLDNGLFDDIMAGLDNWLSSDQWQRGVIPHATTWLNGERWADKIQDPVPTNQYGKAQIVDYI